jgi:hypothetical protein
LCVLGIFYADDLVDEVTRLWRLVAPGGKLAIVTLGPDMLEPVYDVWKTAVLAECPGIQLAQPWERTTDPVFMRKLFIKGGTSNPEVILEPNLISLLKPEDWWTIVMEFTMRETLRSLRGIEHTRVKEKCLAWIRANQVSHLVFNVIYTIAEKKR